jgi:2-oxo-4-hydroxy-4-carboxy-5-ureidoimidazoline decarboxylase
MKSLADVNAMSLEAFIAAFGDVAEHSPWVARNAAGERPFASREAMIAAFAGAVMAASPAAQLALIRAHPDLATRAKLTADSSREQAGAGLDSLSPDEFRRFSELNEAYKAKFDFPFIYAVRGAGKEEILASFAARVNNAPGAEFTMALQQVCRIFRFRIEDRVSP